LFGSKLERHITGNVPTEKPAKNTITEAMLKKMSRSKRHSKRFAKNNFTMNTSLKNYRKAVEFPAKNRVDNLIFNAGDDHAKIIFQNIFRNCDDKIRLLAGNLQNEVAKSGDYLDSLRC
jgi:hypothetical protein